MSYFIEFIGFIGLICLNIIITLIRLGVIPLNYPIGSPLIIVIPMVITYITMYLITFVLSVIFDYYMVNWVSRKTMSLKLDDDDKLKIIVANNQGTGIIQALKRLEVRIIPIKYRLDGIVVVL